MGHAHGPVRCVRVVQDADLGVLDASVELGAPAPAPASGAAAEVALAGDGSGSPTLVMSGTVAEVETGRRGVVVRLEGALAVLARTHVTLAPFESTSVGVIATAIAREAGVGVAIADAPVRLERYTVNPNADAMTNLRALQAMAGFDIYADARGGVVLARAGTAGSSRVVDGRREVLRLVATEGVARGSPAVRGDGGASSPGWAWLSADGASESGAVDGWFRSSALRSAEAVSVASEAWSSARGRRAAPIDVWLVGRPDIAVGDALSVRDGGAVSSAPRAVTRVEHDVHPERGFTTMVRVGPLGSGGALGGLGLG